MSSPPIIIVGAGITGLVLAQALQKRHIPFLLLERDPDPLHRGKGWGITIHWALNTLLELLPQHIIDRLPEAYVDGEATQKGENGNFLYFNLRTAEALWQVPPNKRIRMSREKFRRILMDGIDIKWSHVFESFEPSNEKDSPIQATFSTPSGSQTVSASLIIGCDGSRSRVRSALFPSPTAHTNYRLPVRLLGASVIYPDSIASKALALDPFFFQGGDPNTNVAHWFSFLDSPASSGRGDESRDCQILVSWPYEVGFLGQEKPLEVPAENPDRVKLFKDLSKEWAEPFHSVIQSIPSDAEIKTIWLEDWVPPSLEETDKEKNWHTVPGSQHVVLVGDSAHAMTMFRGEAANHGILDVSQLLAKILPLLEKSAVNGATDSAGSLDEEALRSACRDYTADMVTRTRPAVVLSRQACLDAHCYKRVNDQSPLIARRIAVQKVES